MSIESVMPSNHLILCRPPLLLLSIFPSFRVFSNESTLQVAKVLEFQLQHQSVQWTLSILLWFPTHHGINLSHIYMLWYFLDFWQIEEGRRIKKCVMCQEVESLKKYDNFRALQINLYYCYNRPWALMYIYPINKSFCLYCLKFIFSFISCLSSSL